MAHRDSRTGIILGFALILLVWTGCRDTIESPPGDLLHIEYQPVPYVPTIPEGYPALEQPDDNRMTIDGIHLGRKLFFDPILSLDSTISCSTCHQTDKGFTDGLTKSLGISGTTPRGAMSLLDVGFHYHGLFWDGKVLTLEEQALLPVEDPVEMGEDWTRVEAKLQQHPDYPVAFRQAFGISHTSDISKYLVAKALAQFQRSLISSGNSRYDRFARGEIFLEENEFNGYLMFFDFDPSIPDAECGHCHNAPLFATNDFFNNGIQSSSDLLGFPDKGLGQFTGKLSDNGLFKAPTLRNLAFTAPYMHDGRFETLEEVIEHYNSGGQDSPNKNSFLYPLNLTETQKSDLLAFLLTLTDSTFVTNPDFQNPF